MDISVFPEFIRIFRFIRCMHSGTFVIFENLSKHDLSEVILYGESIAHIPKPCKCFADSV